MDDIDYVVLSDISEINPPTDMHRLDDNTFVSFIPMADVSESGEWINQQTRLLKDVRNRYTYFQEGDILFAKITPCMENGKGAHAVNLLNGIGFGTTEFHVLRAKSCAHPRFIYHWIMNEELRRKAEARMTGSAGQRRVPASFFGEFKVPFLPLSEQRRIAEILDTIDEAIQKTEALISKLKAMNPNYAARRPFIPNYAARRPFIDNQQLISRNFSISPGSSDASVSVSFLFRGCSGISSNANRG